ncbi:MAG: hypothetical protein EHV01_002825 [Spiroplasma sp. hy2]|uniref:hypothetical protein n=1 Tax=Spiroplasma sp. hy2 TaxID=2490850 RepID=UPI003B4D27D0
MEKTVKQIIENEIKELTDDLLSTDSEIIATNWDMVNNGEILQKMSMSSKSN